MRSEADFREFAQAASDLRKEASLSSAVNVAGNLAKRTGSGIWETAGVIGGKSDKARLATLAGGALLTTAAPAVAVKGMRTRDSLRSAQLTPPPKPQRGYY